MKLLHKFSSLRDTLYIDRPIFVKVLLGYLLLSIALLTLTTNLSWLFLRSYTYAATIDDLIAKAHAAAGIIGDAQSPLSEIMPSVERLTGAKALYIDTAYTVSHTASHTRPSNAADRYSLLNSDDRNVAERIIHDGSTETAARYMSLLGLNVLYAGVPVTNAKDEIIGALILYRTQNDVADSAVTVALITTVSMFTAGLISMVLAFMMSRHITQPLSMLTRSARHMAQGHYGELIHLDQNDEIGQLGETLNDMSRRLADNILALQNEKARLELILSAIGEGIVAVDRAGSLLHHNNAALELLEMSSWQPELPGSNSRQLLDMLISAMSSGQRASAQWTNGAGRSIYAGVWPLTGAEGEILGAVGLVRDVSESERLEQMRRDYVANISHELRTPLTGIRGMVEPLLDGYIETEAEKKDCYQVIYQETMRLEKLITEMLDMSRLQSGRLTVELEPVDARAIMDKAVRRLKDRAVRQGVDLRVNAPGDLPMVMGNENRILQVLIILLDNALAFTPAGGRITVYAHRTGAQAFIGVADTGCGISPADLPYIWERFYKADKSRLGTPGTGLGLAIARLVCDLMNGHIDVQSQPGKGATFEFSLKLFTPPEDDQ